MSIPQRISAFDPASLDAQTEDAFMSSMVSEAIDAAPEPIVVHRPDGRLVYWNRAAASVAGHPETDIGDVPPWAWSSTPRHDREERLRQLESAGSTQFTCERASSAEDHRHVEVSSRWVETSSGPVIISIEHDVSERAEAERSLRDMAFRDPLTGLANRAMLEDRLKLAIANAQRHHDTLGVLFIDLDDFKPINDTYGHAAGDFVLKSVAKRMLKTLRAEDTVARVGGDEFVVVLPRLRERGDVVQAAEKVQRIITEPFELDGDVMCCVTASIGHALFDPEHDDAHTLLIRADLAMYHARQTGTDIASATPLD